MPRSPNEERFKPRLPNGGKRWTITYAKGNGPKELSDILTIAHLRSRSGAELRDLLRLIKEGLK